MQCDLKTTSANLKREIEAKNSTIGNEEEDFSLGPLETIALYLELGERNSENGELVFPDFGTEFVNYDMEPDPILKSYIDVYGVNPVGFPPKMTDYI